MITLDSHTRHSVRMFHETYAHPIARTPSIPELELRRLRVKLIAEELCELCDAWGLALRIRSHPSDNLLEVENRVSTGPVPGAVLSVVEAADALGDIDFVTQGAHLVAGTPVLRVMAAIHASNMSKLGADGKPIKREDGKIMKGPNYFKPDIAGALAPFLADTTLDVVQDYP